MFIAALFVIAGKQVFTTRSTDKHAVVYPYNGYYPAINRNKPDILVYGLMDLKNFMMNKRRQTHTTVCTSRFYLREAEQAELVNARKTYNSGSTVGCVGVVSRVGTDCRRA